MRSTVQKRIAILAAAAFVLACMAGCVKTAPRLDPNSTLAPLPTQAEATPSPNTPSPTPTGATGMDALGNYISGGDHYKQYLAFQNIQVYEESGDTFVDAVIESKYPEPLVCAVEIRFFEDGEQVASGDMQTQNGQYRMVLQPGKNPVYAQIDTDMAVTNLNFELIYNVSIGVKPQSN